MLCVVGFVIYLSVLYELTVNFKHILVLSNTNKFMHQLMNINIHIKMHGATINIQHHTSNSPRIFSLLIHMNVVLKLPF